MPYNKGSMLLPNTSFWIFFVLWLKHIYNKEIKEGYTQGIKEGYTQGIIETDAKTKVQQNTRVTANALDSLGIEGKDIMTLSYINTIFKLQKPMSREEASLPIYGNIGVRIGRAIEIFGPFPNTVTK